MLFGRKRRSGPPRLALWDAKGHALFDGRITALQFEEARVIQLSVEFYDDPAPCEIHRSAVVQRAILEIGQALASGQKTPADALSERVRGFFGCYPGTHQLQLIAEADA